MEWKLIQHLRNGSNWLVGHPLRIGWDSKKTGVWLCFLQGSGISKQPQVYVVVSNSFYVHPYLGKMNTIWLAHIFQMGWKPTTNQKWRLKLTAGQHKPFLGGVLDRPRFSVCHNMRVTLAKKYTIPETNMNGWNTFSFPFGKPLFSGAKNC